MFIASISNHTFLPWIKFSILVIIKGIFWSFGTAVERPNFTKNLREKRLYKLEKVLQLKHCKYNISCFG